MNRLCTFLLLLACGMPAWADAIIEGRVELPKPRATPVVAKRYQIVTRGGVLAPFPPVAVVYLEGSFPRAAELPVQQMVQKDLTFVNPLLPVRLGTRVEFPNLDDTFHNIFSFSPTKRFDLGRYSATERPIPSQVFDKPGLVTLRCDIHEHMRALILVLDTPHFTMTNAAGRFRLSGLPAGSYQLKAWVDSRTTHEKRVTIGASGKQQIDFP
jgi:plastocyanin